RRNFKAFLVWDAEAGKVNFEFEQRESKYPPRKTAAGAAAKAPAKTAAAKKAPAAKKAAAKTTARKPAAANYRPDAALAAVIGDGAVARTEVVKKVWDYVKAHNLQDPKDKRIIVADAKLLPVFGKDRIGMFELTGIVGKHLVSND
ncbi:MAG: SWIB/MDM2 domain-containing protein, partial [Comamonas sp.]